MLWFDYVFPQAKNKKKYKQIMKLVDLFTQSSQFQKLL